MLQSPQCCGLVLASTQLVPQAVNPAAQVAEQTPAEQTCGATHAVPQAPQLFPSSLMFVHPLGHEVRPAWH